MKKLISILFVCLLPFFTNAQTANAGANQTIYLTSGTTATLDGSGSSGTSYLWTDVSSDYSSGATISNPTSKIATVSGLPQGVWYFQIAVTTGGTTHTDITTVTVDYAPISGTVLSFLDMGNSTMISYINDRSSTAQLSGYPDGVNVSGTQYFFDRERSLSMAIDAQKTKFTSTIEDGYHWQANTGYGRTEGSWGTGWALDTTKTYDFLWKGYYPQDFSYLATNQTVGSLMQIHPGAAGTYVPFGFSILNGTDGGNTHRGTVGVKALYFQDAYPADNIAGYYLLIHLDSMYNQTHTIELIVREGADNPHLEVKVDGVTKYIRTSGTISITPNEDYPKFATVYDYENALCDPTNHTRGRSFSLVTESFKAYDITSAVAPPTANAGANQTITLPTSSVSLSGSATHASGTTATYLWSKISGSGSPTISGGTTLTATVSGFTVADTYVYRLTVNQSDGQVATNDVTITVNSSTAAPAVSTSGNTTLTLPTNSTTVYSTPTAASGHAIISYSWTQLSGGAYSITAATSQNTGLTGLSLGTHVFQIMVTQDDAQTATATLTITVNSAAAPTINAGSNQTQPHGSNISLAATYTLASGYTGAFNWVNETNGSGTFSAQTSSATTVSGLADGSYRFGCTLNQSDGQTAYDYVLVTINSTPQTINIIINHKKKIFINSN